MPARFETFSSVRGTLMHLGCLTFVLALCLADPQQGEKVTIGGEDDWKGYEDIFIFAQQGPISFTKLPDLSVELPASTGCSKARCRVSLSVTLPTTGSSTSSKSFVGPGVPLAIVSPGFLVPKKLYSDYAERLASFGFAVMVWEPLGEMLPFWINSHRTLALSVHHLWLWASEQCNDPTSLLSGGFNSSSGFMLVGHSRGAKVNSLAAAWFPQDVRGIVNIDPVDSLPPFHRLSPDYPSALPLVRGLSTPTLNVGSQLGNQSALFGKACVPQGENFEAFFDASNRGWMLEILGAGHLQFLGEDGKVACLECEALKAACKRGKQSDSQVRALTMTAMAAWLSKCAGGQGEIGLYVVYWSQVLEAKGLAISRHKEKQESGGSDVGTP